MSGPEFTTQPASNDGPHIALSATAAENWETMTTGFANLHFYKRQRGSVIVRCYAEIPKVPTGSEGRAIAVWILAHPWRIPSAVRMVHAFVALRRRTRRAS